MAHILLMKGQSQYDAMRYYIDEVEIGFRLAGFHTIVLDTMEESYLFQFEEIVNSGMGIDFIFDYNAINMDIKDRVVSKLKNACYITYLCDHPAAHDRRLKKIDARAVVFVCDALHEEYIRRYYPNIKYVKYIPLSGSYSTKQVPFKERSIDVIFTGSYMKADDVYQNRLLQDEGVLKEFAKFMVKDIIQNPQQPIEMCLERAIDFFGIWVSEEEFKELVGEFLFIDRYARDYYRDQVIRVLVEHGIKVHVFGKGWEAFESPKKENLVIEEGNSYVARKAVANAKISLNVMPWFKAGFQERIASAMLSGTVALTDGSKYIDGNFEDGKELVVYSLEDLDRLPGKVKTLLDNGGMAGQIASVGKERADKELTWQHRVFEMVGYIQKNIGGTPISQQGSGAVMQVPYKRKQNRLVGRDAIRGIEEILGLMENIRKFDVIDVCDLKYLYQKFLLLFLKIKANFPEVAINKFVYDFIEGLKGETLSDGIEFFIMECMKFQSIFLKAENKELIQENGYLHERNRRTHSEWEKISRHENETIIKKILQNYSDSEDREILEIIPRIKERGWITTYNQEFADKYAGAGKVSMVFYDEACKMHYVDWDGKRMYYPRGYSKENVAVQANFARMEQDQESPHCYLGEGFDVCEGDVVIDAGVAEGNFALGIVEKAGKVYLVECGHHWVEALEQTFRPWKEKVVIIEGMLGEKSEGGYVSIDSIVKEEEINFIKMDIEGSENAALKGASKLLRKSRNLKCAVCAYHKKNAEKDIKKIFETHGFTTATTRGYMFFKDDLDSWVDGEFRRGIVRAMK